MGIPRLYRWVQQYRACGRLYPLWRDLCRALPEVAMRGVALRLIRRVVQIRGCGLALRDHVPAGPLELARQRRQAACLSAEEEQATVEAASLAAAPGAGACPAHRYGRTHAAPAECQ